MLEGTSKDDLDSAADFFSTLGSETRKRKQPPPVPDPDKVRATLIEPVSLTKLLRSTDEDQLKGIEYTAEGREVA